MSTTLDRLLGLVPEPPKKQPRSKRNWIDEFIALGYQQIDGYSEAGAARKERFHFLGRKLCKQIAEQMGLKPGEYDIRSNKAGIACLGEVTRHTEGLYLQFGGSVTPCGLGFMYRHCEGRKDYTGGRNMWMQYEKLADLPTCVEHFKRMAGPTFQVIN